MPNFAGRQAGPIDEQIRESLYLLRSTAKRERERGLASKREDEQGNPRRERGGVGASKAMAKAIGPNFIPGW